MRTVIFQYKIVNINVTDTNTDNKTKMYLDIKSIQNVYPYGRNTACNMVHITYYHYVLRIYATLVSFPLCLDLTCLLTLLFILDL